MEWWTHLWLNEGFATWVSYLANDSLFPEWKVWTQFLVESTEGLRLNGLAESHPIDVEVNHAGEIDEIFHAISYCKGAAKSLAAYIKKHACSNAKTEDPWAALEEDSGEPVNKLTNLWRKQKGYPVVSVKIKDEMLEFEQVRSQDALCGLSVCREGRETAWTWLKFSSFERAKEVEEFFSTPTKAAMARTLKQSIERVHINTQWVQSVQNDKHLSEIVQELARRKN
ncbi:hypothetical protein CDL15_Pgr015587 [Punica granatum]|uniref:Peptidase M1 membrane alanine aminopeptidase domain-containing protein n=1 Tax=Punica granatum TaxID=22663 RepID=A0A218XQK8_PUNGR|nr:hypothetical protein CDL15_Pgr015587 [Punica granatum]